MTRPLRHLTPGLRGVNVSTRPDGQILLRSPHALEEYPRTICERLVQWGEQVPERVWLAKRGPDGQWRTLCFGEALTRVRRIAQGLLAYPLDPEHPVLVLSESSLEHALIGMAAQYIGIPYVPVSPAYSLVSADFAKLRHILDLTTPGLVFVQDGVQFQKAVDACVAAEIPVVAVDRLTDRPGGLSFAQLEAGDPGPEVEAAYARVGPDTIAKVLFTSGSTGFPKGVINTQRMLCCNQQMYLQLRPYLAENPPCQLDWSPWHHTAGGNAAWHNSLYNGGTLYLDEGRPLPGLIEKTVANLREISPTFYFSVPKGYEALLPYLQNDEALRKNFFRRLCFMNYAGAALPQSVWHALDDLAYETCGERITISTELGSTETAPINITANWDAGMPGVIGLPAPGTEVKLVPVQGKLESRYRGPHITPGYWRNEAATQAAFDEEGYFKSGDAVRFVDPDDPQKGLIFDGRIGDDFKLSTGTWVHAMEMRNRVLSVGAPYVQDVVLVGHDEDELGGLLIPSAAAVKLSPRLNARSDLREICADPAVREEMQRIVNALHAGGTGSSNRLARAILLDRPLSMDAGELTDKGSINSRAVREHHRDLVTQMYQEPVSPLVLRPKARG